MENKKILMEINEKIKNSDMKKNKRFKSLMQNLATTNTKDMSESIIELCLQYKIDCQEIINKYSEVKESKLSEEEFRKMLYITLI